MSRQTTRPARPRSGKSPELTEHALSVLRLQGFEENTGGFQNPQYPLVMSLENVVATDPRKVNLIASDTQFAIGVAKDLAKSRLDLLDV